MNIPDEAVEAGYQAVNYLVIGRDEIRAILEAAHPYLVMRGDERAQTQYRRNQLGDFMEAP